MVTTRSKRPLPQDSKPLSAANGVATICDKGTTPKRRRNVADKENTKPKAATPKPSQPVEVVILQRAKNVFRVSTAPSRLVGRDKEKAALDDFFARTVLERKPGSIYISGAPGTGKTALVEQMLTTLKKQARDVRLVKINCMTVGDRPKTIYARILAELKEDCEVSGCDAEAALLDRIFSRKAKQFCVLLLDEVDHLMSRDQEILYRIFGWAGLAQSKCCVVGIANALDLTKRFLPRLQSKNCLPEVLAVPPYDVADTCAIIHDRMAEINEEYYSGTAGSLFQSAAVELCARKVATTGDLRKALDICCQAVEFAEADIKGRQQNSGSLPRVTVQHVLRVLNSVFGAANPTVAKVRGLNPQQKLVLVLILLIERERRERKHTTHLQLETSVSRLFETYLNQCNRHNVMPAVSRAEFFVLLDGIGNTGLVDLVKSSGTPGHSGCSTPRSNQGNGAGSKKGTPVRQQMFTPSKSKKLTGNCATPTRSLIIESTTRLSLLASEEDVMNGLDSVEFLKELLTVGLPADAFPNAI